MVGSTEYLVTEISGRPSLWSDLLSSDGDAIIRLRALLMSVRATSPAQWFQPQVFADINVTEEMARILERFDSLRCTQLDSTVPDYLDESRLMDYCLVAVEDTVSSRALTKFAGQCVDELVSRVRHYAFHPPGLLERLHRDWARGLARSWADRKSFEAYIERLCAELAVKNWAMGAGPLQPGEKYQIPRENRDFRFQELTFSLLSDGCVWIDALFDGKPLEFRADDDWRDWELF